MSITIFITGGTFDKEYDEINGRLYFKNTHLPEMLRTGKCTLGIRVKTLMMLDSLDMTDDDRQMIVAKCRQCSEDKIIITHGTDTMQKTAAQLAASGIPKTIVLTGAMIPYKFGSSDGFFNIGSALAFVQTMPHGVYVAMNGCCFGWDKVKKNKKTGEFEMINE